MKKIEKNEHLQDYDEYNNMPIDPVLTLGDFIACQSRIDRVKDSVQCDLCHREHIVPRDGFEVVRKHQDALNIQLNTLAQTLKFALF